MSADKTSVERNGAICYNIFKFKNHSRYNLNEELDTCLKLHSNKNKYQITEMQLKEKGCHIK